MQKLNESPLKSVAQPLADFAIFSIEQLTAVMNEKHLTTWLESIRIENEIIKRYIRYLEPYYLQYNQKQLRFSSMSAGNSFGLNAASTNTLTATPIDVELLPSSVDLLDEMLPPKNQGNRPTCVANAMGSAAEQWFSLQEELSPEAIYYYAKKIDGDDAPGTSLYSACKAVENYGIPLARLAPYQPLPSEQPPNGTPPNTLAEQDALMRKVDASWVSYNTEGFVNTAKAFLSGYFNGMPRTMIIGLAIYPSFENHYTERTGDVSLPLPYELESGPADYHAMLIVGMRDNAGYPGGGYALVLNSWGELFADRSEVAPGIARIPYAYLEQHGQATAALLLPSEKTLFGAEYSVAEREREKEGEKIVLGKNQTGLPLIWSPAPYANKHMVITGESGMGKSTWVKHWIGLMHNTANATPQVHIIDAHGEYAELSRQLSCCVVDVTEKGLPFSLVDTAHKSASAHDIAVKHLLEDMCWAGGNTLGVIQTAELEGMLNGLLSQPDNSNQCVKRAILNAADKRIAKHLASLSLLLRADEPVDLDNVDVIVHNLSDFAELPDVAAMYSVMLLRYLKTRQKHHSGRETYLVLEEVPQLFRHKGGGDIERLFTECRKVNLAGVFVAQQIKSVPVSVMENAAHHMALQKDDKGRHCVQWLQRESGEVQQLYYDPVVFEKTKPIREVQRRQTTTSATTRTATDEKCRKDNKETVLLAAEPVMDVSESPREVRSMPHACLLDASPSLWKEYGIGVLASVTVGAAAALFMHLVI